MAWRWERHWQARGLVGKLEGLRVRIEVNLWNVACSFQSDFIGGTIKMCWVECGFKTFKVYYVEETFVLKNEKFPRNLDTLSKLFRLEVIYIVCWNKTMAVLNSCCFWHSVRKGSYVSGIYTLVRTKKDLKAKSSKWC